MCFGRAFRPASGVAQVFSAAASQVFGILASNAAFDCPKSGCQPVTPTRRTNPTIDFWSVMGRKFARLPQAPQCFPPHSLVGFDLNSKPIANRRVLKAASPPRYGVDSMPRFGTDAVAIAIRRDFLWLLSTRSRDGIPGETRCTGASSAPACADPEDSG